MGSRLFAQVLPTLGGNFKLHLVFINVIHNPPFLTLPLGRVYLSLRAFIHRILFIRIHRNRLNLQTHFE